MPKGAGIISAASMPRSRQHQLRLGAELNASIKLSLMSARDQKAKYSLRANDVRCGPDNRHTATTAACPKTAMNRHSQKARSLVSVARVDLSQGDFRSIQCR